MLRDTHLKINLDCLDNNVREIKNLISPDVILGAVLKANAYGHGSKGIAKHLYENGVNHFLVSSLIEAIQLRRENVHYKILIMGHTPDQYLNHVISNDLTATIFTFEQAYILNKLAKNQNKKAVVHLKIETGFNRLGLQVDEHTVSTIKQIVKLDNLIIEGIFTHLALTNKEKDYEQYTLFMHLIGELENHKIKIPIKHVCDSIGMVLYPEMNLNMVRVGALLYGLQSEEKGKLKIQQVMTFHTKISHIKELKKGECISYGNRWQAKDNTSIATLPFGYSDGYPRNMYKKGRVTINNKAYPIVGVICMDQCMIDLKHDKVTFDDDVVIIGDGRNNTLSFDAVSSLAQTNKNEIVSRFTSRVPKVYIKNNRIFNIEQELL